MSKVNMAVDFGGVKMQNPINTAAGTFGYGWQFQNFFDVSRLGAITTKGCAAEPWPGNPAPRMAEVRGGMINSVGLQNPGVRAFAEQSGPWLEQLSKDGCQVVVRLLVTPLRSMYVPLSFLMSFVLGLLASKSMLVAPILLQAVLLVALLPRVQARLCALAARYVTVLSL